MMACVEKEFTVTLLIDANDFADLSRYFSQTYKSNCCYETVIRYNGKAVDRIEKFKEENEQIYSSIKKGYRVILRNQTPIEPELFERFVVPENYEGRSFCGIQATTTVCHYQQKETISQMSEVVPYVSKDEKIFLISCTWKSSMEIDLDANTFEKTVIRNINDTDKSFVPSFGQCRYCVYDVSNTNVRMTIGKGFDLGGTQEGRRPINEYYYVEFEMEETTPSSSSNVKLHPPTSLEIKRFVYTALSLLPSSIIENIISGSKKTCVDADRRLHELLQDKYVRKFTHDFEKFRASLIIDETTKIVKNLFIAPKWNGVRGIGVWDNDTVIVKTPKCLREFSLPSICFQRLIVQVEMLTTSFDRNLIDDRIVITEIMGVSLCEKKQTYGRHKKLDWTSNVDPPVTFAPLYPLYSMELIARFHKHNPRFFTHYRNGIREDALFRLFFNTLDEKACLAQTDGYLAIALYDEGRQSLYAKIKCVHSIELLYDLSENTLKSHEGDFDFMSSDGNVRIDDFEPEKQRWYWTGLDSRTIIIEFNVYKLNDIPCTLTDDLSEMWRGVKLVYKKYRCDKFVPDCNTKIFSIINNVIRGS